MRFTSRRVSFKFLVSVVFFVEALKEKPTRLTMRYLLPHFQVFLLVATNKQVVLDFFDEFHFIICFEM